MLFPVHHSFTRNTCDFIHCFTIGYTFSQINVVHHTVPFGNDRGGEWIPFSDFIAALTIYHHRSLRMHHRVSGDERVHDRFHLKRNVHVRFITIKRLLDQQSHYGCQYGLYHLRYQYCFVPYHPVLHRRWNVRMVSCVPGSPMDWAAITPTASPMSTWWPRAKSRP